MTIQSNKPPDRETRPTRAAERKTELVCRVKYCNTLPDIPFDPKFIQYPFHPLRFINYQPTSLERNYKYDILTEHDLGLTIDLVDKDVFNVDPNATLDPRDEKLLEEDILTPQDSKRSRHHALSVSWLRRTEYISTEQTRFQPQTMDKVEAKVGYSIRKNFKEDTVYMDRDSQIKAIEKTFADAKIPITQHYSKPNVHPVEILPVFPDFDGWKYPCAQVIFDSDPAPTALSVPSQIEEMSQAMIRGVMDESGEQFVAYFLPTEETLEKRRQDQENNIEYEDDQEYEYKMAREYNWNVKNKASKGYEENYFFVVRNDGIYYNELETRVRLSKRRQKPGQAPGNTRLVVKHRPVNETEYRMQRYRERQLEPPGEEEEGDEEPEMEQENITIRRTGGNADKSDDEGQSGSERNDSDAGSNDSDRATSKRRGRKIGSGSEGEDRKSRSRSRSSGSDRSKKSGSRSRSGSAASKKSGSRSGSADTKKSRSRSGSAGSKKSRSRSNSAGSKKSRSRSGSADSKKSRSRSGSAASKKSRSRSGSAASKKSRSRSGSPGSKHSRSRSGSAASKRSGSGSRSRSGSPASKRSGSAGSRKSRSGSGSRSPSPAKGRQSKSKSKSRSGSPRSGSGSPAGQKTRNRSRSGSASSRGSNKSASASPANRRSPSADSAKSASSYSSAGSNKSKSGSGSESD